MTRTADQSDRSPTILWIHGAGLSGSTWRSDIPGLKPDLPGHGAAPRISDPTVERYADSLEARLPDQCALVGHSLGGMVALELAARHRDRVQALVLVEAVPTFHLPGLGMMAARIGMEIMATLGPKGVARLSGFAGPEPVPSHLKQQLGRMSRGGARDALKAAIRYDGRPRLSDITAPALVIIGGQIKIMDDGARAFQDGIAQVEVKTIPGGHMLYIEAGDAFYEQVSAFLDLHTPSCRPA